MLIYYLLICGFIIPIWPICARKQKSVKCAKAFIFSCKGFEGLLKIPCINLGNITLFFFKFLCRMKNILFIVIFLLSDCDGMSVAIYSSARSSWHKAVLTDWLDFYLWSLWSQIYHKILSYFEIYILIWRAVGFAI